MAKQTKDSGRLDDRRAEDTTPGVAGDDTRALVHGVSVAQFDALDRSLRMIAAHGDLLATVQAADLAPGTLPVIGQAILEEARSARDLLGVVEGQRLAREDGDRSAVEEGRAGYGAPGLRLAGPAVATVLH